MFRKFMIVCWVIFGLLIVIAAINGYTYFRYGDQIAGLTYQEAEDIGIIDPYKIDEAEILMYMAILNAAMMLAWIVLFYTGHWVWKRRKVKDNIHQRQLAKVLRKQKDQLEEL